MQVDQTKLPDSLSYSHNTQDSAKGIENYIGVSGARKEDDGMSIRSADSVDMSGATYLRPQAGDNRTVADTLAGEEASAMDRYNEMAVISNTTSQEDLKKLQQEGFSVSDTDSRTIITVTDKIKAALAKAGVDISAYGDALSKEQLEEITGSAAMANQIVAELTAHDLPATEQNVTEMEAACEKLGQLEPLGEGAMTYLIKNKWTPTIENIYRAGYSYSESRSASAAISDMDFAQMREQIEQVIRDAGLQVNERTLEDSRFLMQQGLMLTADNLAYLEDLRGLSEQIAIWNENNAVPEEMLSSMCDAIEEGARPMDAMLMDGYSLMDRARMSAQVIADATEEDLAYVIAQEKEITIENLRSAEANRRSDTKTTNAVRQIVSEQGLALITAKRQLEEVRLAMTSEANYALLKKGISIDTRPLADLVEELKGQEDAYYRALLDQEGIATEENVSVFRETHQVLNDLKSAPAYVIRPGDPDTLRTLHQEGMAQKEAFAKANESYEALMTAPRRDMGDSIQKAFANVDDILKDLGLETSEANRRAVRILAYNQTELTPENIAEVKAKDEEVQRAFSNLTPKVVLEMIRKEINPLDMEMDELNQAAQQIRSELTDEDTQRFQKYLWKLEQNSSISEEERSSYIGIYRLIAQVEKTDGAAIGSLMQQGTDITMRSLLTAVRTEKRGAVDYQVDEQFSGVDKLAKNARIDEQIMAAYHKNCMHDAVEQMTPQAAETLSTMNYEEMSPEQIKEVVAQAADDNREADNAMEQQYLHEQLTEFSKMLTTPEEIYELLERANIPNTMNNIQAVRRMMADRNEMFDTLWNAKGATAEAMEKIEDMKEMILERFGEAVKSPTEMADAQEALAEVAEHVMDTMIIENDPVSTLDIKALRLMHTQFGICAKRAQEESYMIPIQTGEGVTGVSLKIVRGKKEKGMVDILFHGNVMGKVAATFEAKEKGISGMIATDDEETRQLLSDHLGMLAEALNGENGEAVDLRVAKVSDQSLERYANSTGSRSLEENDASAEEEYSVQTTRLYHIAESFIKTIQEFL